MEAIQIQVKQGLSVLTQYELSPNIIYDCVKQGRDEYDKGKIVYVDNPNYEKGNWQKPQYIALTSSEYITIKSE